MYANESANAVLTLLFILSETGLCLFCLSMLCQSSKRRNGEILERETPSEF